LGSAAAHLPVRAEARPRSHPWMASGICARENQAFCGMSGRITAWRWLLLHAPATRFD